MLTLLEKLSISLEDRQDWYRAMASACQAGQNIEDTLVQMQQSFEEVKHPLGPLVTDVLRKRRGVSSKVMTVAQALADTFPGDECQLIAAGLESGRIPDGFENAAKLAGDKITIRNAVLGALAYPALLITALCSLLYFLSFKLLPQFEKSRPRSVWPSYAQKLGGLADNSVWIIGGVVLTAVAISFVVLYVAPRWIGPTRDRFDRWVLPFPLIRDVAGSNFLKTLAAYVGAGLPLVDSIKAVQSSASPYMSDQCARLLFALKQGGAFKDAVRKMTIVNRRYFWLIAVYSLGKNEAQAYATISTEMTKVVIKHIRTILVRIVSPLVLLLVASIVLWTAASLYGIAAPTKKKLAASFEFTSQAVFIS